METASIQAAVPVNLPSYSQLTHQFDPDRRALWVYLQPHPRPCFTPALLSEIRDLQSRLADGLSQLDHADPLRYLVYASATPQVFNLGGDVELFSRLISAGDRETLRRYGRICTEAVYANVTSLGIDTLTTIALVQGTALGGGFEGALSCNVIIAEESAPLGFPEILFNLFPGMGAMSLLTRRIEPARAERLIASGNISTGRELWESGVIDEVAPDGEGVLAVNDYIRRHERQANGRLALRRARNRVQPLSNQELLDIVDIWVDAAMRLTARDLRMMARIVAAQSRLGTGARQIAESAPMARSSTATVTTLGAVA